jgi:hypothetical protein
VLSIVLALNLSSRVGNTAILTPLVVLVKDLIETQQHLYTVLVIFVVLRDTALDQLYAFTSAYSIRDVQVNIAKESRVAAVRILSVVRVGDKIRFLS